MPRPRYNHGYPCVDGWLRQCEQYFAELDDKGGQLQSYLQGVLRIDIPTEPLDIFVQRWVHVLSRLATRNILFTDPDIDADFAEHRNTRICVIDEGNEFKLTHITHPDIFISSNRARREENKKYRAYLLVNCKSNSVGSRSVCNECLKSNNHDCNGSNPSVFMAEVFGLLHARYIAIPTYDTLPKMVNDIDKPYLKFYLEQHPTHGDPVIQALIQSLQTAPTPNNLSMRIRAEEKVYLDDQLLKTPPQALCVVVE